jgi:hypothetical protein
MANDENGAWLPLAAASRALDVTVDVLRKRIAAREVEARKDNKNRWLVRVPAQLAAASEPLADDETAASLREELAEARAELAVVHGKLTDALVAAGRAEGELVAVRTALAREQARADRLEERLALPWWKRLLG